MAHLGEEFPVEQLKPFHVKQYLSTRPHWKRGTIRTLWQAGQRLTRWGSKSGRIPCSVVSDYPKPGRPGGQS